MESVSVGEIVFVRFPFSDLSQYKLRPALVLAQAGKSDFILCQITSRAYADAEAIQLRKNHLATGYLRKISYVRPEKLFTTHIGIMEKTVACVKPEIRQITVHKIIERLNAEICS